MADALIYFLSPFYSTWFCSQIILTPVVTQFGTCAQNLFFIMFV